jgi:hypothetical protein
MFILLLVGKTFEGGICSIPFIESSKRQFFCISLLGVQIDFYCKVDETYNKCRLGKFLGARSNNDGSPFSSTFLFKNPIKLQEAGTYQLKFYTFFNCEKNCESIGDDSILIKISSSFDSKFKIIAEILSRKGDLAWKNEDVVFNMKNTDLYVC